MVRFGLHLPWFGWSGSPETDQRMLRDISQAAEDAGFFSLWVSDHFFQHPPFGQATDPLHESYLLLGYLAGVTERIALGSLVSGVTYRHPGILVKQVTSLDVLSGGRAWFGIGAAWNEREHLGLGIPFPPIRERFERLDEALQITRQMWSSNNGAYHGRHYVLEETICSPLPLQRPHPPILVGGTGSRTLRLAAKHADAVNLLFADGPQMREKLMELKRICDDLGRDYRTIEPGSLRIVISGADLLDETRELVRAGARHIIYAPQGADVFEFVSTFGREVIASSLE